MPAAMPSERPDLYVVARILEKLWRVGEPMVKTRLQIAANVNYDVFSKYLSWLISRKLVILVGSQGSHERVAITEKGRAAYRRLVEWIDEFVRGQRSYQ